MSISVERLKQIEAGFSDDGELYVSDAVGDCPGVMADVRCALRELIEIKERQAKPVHSCKIPGCASCGSPPDSYDALDDLDEDLQALMDRGMED